jgi:hypothetical protein
MATLKDRRASVAGEIYELKRQIGKRKQILAHLDAGNLASAGLF